MLQTQSRKMKTLALLTGGVLMASATVTTTAPAHAADKEKLYKGGAVALGVLGAYFLIKGKTLPAVAAGAGAYYAYKKGKDADSDNNVVANGDVYPDGRYSYNDSTSSSSYPEYNSPDYGYSSAVPSQNGSNIVLK